MAASRDAPIPPDWGGRLRPESVAAFKRNQWQPSPGIGGRLRPESVATFDRNTQHGKPVFSTSTVPNGSLDDLTYIADADYDAVIIEMEHEGFSFTTLRSSLQVLLNRKRIAEKGNLQPDVVPMVRIPPN